MALEGKKINELNSLTTVTGETVLPVVYVQGQSTSDTAQKVTISQISTKVQNDLSDTLALKQDKLTAGEGITINNQNVISATGTVQAIESISSTSGTISLQTNKIYRVTLNGNTTFSLPSSVNNSIFNQILVQVNITSSLTINFGTTKYFDEEPEIEQGYCNLIFEYDSIQQAWVVGLLQKI